VPQQLRFDISRDNGRVTIAISGDLDMAGTLRLQPQLDRLIEEVRPDVLVLDLRGVDFVDSVGLSLLVEVHEAALGGEFRLAIVRGTREVQRIFELAGYDGRPPVRSRSRPALSARSTPGARAFPPQLGVRGRLLT
jgi:anti-anti-sigma factor